MAPSRKKVAEKLRNNPFLQLDAQKREASEAELGPPKKPRVPSSLRVVEPIKADPTAPGGGEWLCTTCNSVNQAGGQELESALCAKATCRVPFHVAGLSLGSKRKRGTTQAATPPPTPPPPAPAPQAGMGAISKPPTPASNDGILSAASTSLASALPTAPLDECMDWWLQMSGVVKPVDETNAPPAPSLGIAHVHITSVLDPAVSAGVVMVGPTPAAGEDAASSEPAAAAEAATHDEPAQSAALGTEAEARIEPVLVDIGEVGASVQPVGKASVVAVEVSAAARESPPMASQEPVAAVQPAATMLPAAAVQPVAAVQPAAAAMESAAADVMEPGRPPTKKASKIPVARVHVDVFHEEAVAAQPEVAAAKPGKRRRLQNPRVLSKASMVAMLVGSDP